ncbi:unnamed protein product [Adineta steineri]|uniref:UAS domain-containing protein n=1 Tax=Adineta steineri TaxID=433720 RepID=A0A820APS8_9BILA|nr:unnamed protein product [Adineta steineri]
MDEANSNTMFKGYDENLSDSENPSADDVRTVQERFTQVLSQRYPFLRLEFDCGPLDEAIVSMISPDRRPLILYIHNDRSVATHIFCERVLCTDKIASCLDENFTIWPWDRTSDINYTGLLVMLNKHCGQQIKDVISSFATDDYPLLCCLIWNEGQVKVADTIQGTTSIDDTLNRLNQVRDSSDSSVISPPPMNGRILRYP